MYEMIEKGKRGGVCQVSSKYAKANNKYMKSYNQDIISRFPFRFHVHGCGQPGYGQFSKVQSIMFIISISTWYSIIIISSSSSGSSSGSSSSSSSSSRRSSIARMGNQMRQLFVPGTPLNSPKASAANSKQQQQSITMTITMIRQ